MTDVDGAGEGREGEGREHVIVLNRARCVRCRDEPISRHRHDYRSCRCGLLSVDGGRAYLRRVLREPYDPDRDPWPFAETSIITETWRRADGALVEAYVAGVEIGCVHRGLRSLAQPGDYVVYEPPGWPRGGATAWPTATFWANHAKVS